jgi:hypothetical protein
MNLVILGGLTSGRYGLCYDLAMQYAYSRMFTYCSRFAMGNPQS